MHGGKTLRIYVHQLLADRLSEGALAGRFTSPG